MCAPPTPAATGRSADRTERVEAWVSTDDYLENALAAMLLTDYGWVAVVDGDDFLGVLTPDAIYCALRSSLDEAEQAGDPTTSAAPNQTGHDDRSTMNTTNRHKVWTAPEPHHDWVTAHFGHR